MLAPTPKRRTTYVDRVSIAEMATKGVAFHLCREDLLAAAALQKFAALAWADEDEVSDDDLLLAVLDTMFELHSVVGAEMTRDFLRDAFLSILDNADHDEEEDGDDGCADD